MSGWQGSGIMFAFTDVGRPSLEGDRAIPWFVALDCVRVDKMIQTPGMFDCGCDKTSWLKSPLNDASLLWWTVTQNCKLK